MTRIDMRLFNDMDEPSQKAVQHFIRSNGLPIQTIEMEDTPAGLRVLYLASDDNGQLVVRGGEPVTETMLVPDLKLPWENL